MDYKKINYNEYAKQYSLHRTASSRVVEHVMDRLEDYKISKVLEVGCGTADHLFVLKENIGFEAHGFDKSTEMLKAGEQKNPGLHLAEGDANNTFPYEDGTFDLVFSINVIHYIENLENYFKEALRVTDEHGVVLTIIANRDKMKKSMGKYFSEMNHNIQSTDSFIEQISSNMKQAGFEDIRVTNTDYDYNMKATDLDAFKNKVFAWVRLLPEECYRQGIALMEEDVRQGKCLGSENFTYIWGFKR